MSNKLPRCHHVGLLVTTLVAGWISLSANAEEIVFEDTFDTETLGLSVAGLTNWAVTAGNVDVIGPGLWDLYPNNGRYLDLDGSCGNAHIESSPIVFAPGDYALSFELGYNYYGIADGTHVLDVYVGNYLLFSDLDPMDFATQDELALMMAEFSVNTETTASLRFVQKGAVDCVGAILDDVSLSLLDPELPTDAKQCKKGGWRDFGVFKNGSVRNSVSIL